jgi:peptidoglycan L-alanyl-D-glutamate endopeptidase CwlK
MNKFSQRSLDNLETCHMDLQVLFNEVIKYFDCTITEGHRGEVAQNKAFAEGKSKLKWPHGNHNKFPSMAVDAYPCPIELNPKTQREAEIYKWKMAYFAGQVTAIARELKTLGKISHDVIWGCDWDGDHNLKEHTLFDFPHFELR